MAHAVDGLEIRGSPVEVGSLSHYLQGFIHPRWVFGISSINRMFLAVWYSEIWRCKTNFGEIQLIIPILLDWKLDTSPRQENIKL